MRTAAGPSTTKPYAVRSHVQHAHVMYARHRGVPAAPRA
ncbi:hypothetical protein HNP02_006256 [Mycobacterium sp. AZCC_0083]|nr:hypothetical protein [Mycobacterium sp. AZCC_0083]